MGTIDAVTVLTACNGVTGLGPARADLLVVVVVVGGRWWSYRVRMVLGEMSEASFRALGNRVMGLTPILAEYLFLADDDDEIGRRRIMQQAALLQGLLWHASDIVLDELFEDVEAAELARGTGEWAASESFAVGFLPEQYADRYDVRFIRRFLVQAAVVTSRLAGEWSPPRCVADELVVRLLLDKVQVLVESYELRVGPEWRGDLEDMLLEDADAEMLYGDQDDPLVRAILANGENLDFDDWFVPFGDGGGIAPYAAAVDEPRT